MALYEETRKIQEELNQKYEGGDPFQKLLQETKDYNSTNITPSTPTTPLDESIYYGQSDNRNYRRFFGENYDPSQNLENAAAQRQSGFERMAFMAPRVAAKFVSEVAQMPGYLGGGIAWGLHGFDKQDIGMLVDNFWQQSIKGLEKDVVDKLPVYTSDAIKSGSLVKNIFSTAFWANEGAVGIGFLLAFLAPGAALRGLKFGTKMAKLIKPGTSFAKTVDATGDAAKATSKLIAGQKLAANINDITSTVVNTIFESAAEGGQVYNSVLEKTGDVNKASEAAVKTLRQNIGVLSISNYIDQKWLFGQAKLIKNYSATTAKELATGNVFKRAMGETGAILDEVAKRTTMENIGRVSKTIGAGFVKEGFWEEGAQFAIQKNAEKGEDNPQGFLGELRDIAETYYDSLGDVDMQKSVFLGGVLGSGMSSVQTVKQGKAEDKMLSNFHSSVKTNFIDRYRNISDLAETNSEGEPQFNDDGSYKIDEVKAQEAASKNMIKYVQGKLLVEYAKEGNIEAFEKLKNERDLNYFFPFLQQEGGMEAALLHIDDLAETDIKAMQKEGVPIDLETTKKELKDKVIKYQKLYDRVTNAHEMNMDIVHTEDENSIFKEYSDVVFGNKIGSEATLQHSAERINKLRNELSDFEATDTTSVPITSEETKYNEKLVDDLLKSLDSQKSKLSPVDLINARNIIKNINGHVNAVQEANNSLKDYYSKTFLTKDFKDYVDWKNSKDSNNKDVNEEVKKEEVVEDIAAGIKARQEEALANATSEEEIDAINKQAESELEDLKDITASTPKVSTKTEKPVADENMRDIDKVDKLLIEYGKGAKHPFSINAGIANWLVTTGNQNQANTNDDVARWYIFVNNDAYKKELNGSGRSLYILKSYTYDQVGKLDINDPIRQNVTFFDGKSQKLYDKISKEGAIEAKNDIKIVVLTRDNKVLKVSKLGEIGVEDKSQIIHTSLPTHKAVTAKGFDRFGTEREKALFYSRNKITNPTKAQQDNAETFVQDAIAKSLDAYGKYREALKVKSESFSISSINPGVKVIPEGGLQEVDILEGSNLPSA